jgi:hypothetical protein
MPAQMIYRSNLSEPIKIKAGLAGAIGWVQVTYTPKIFEISKQQEIMFIR